ncbi:hypothetical protein BGX23_007682 [Mortierella sp. AD031]|nr:hypothetical protein BGX23_007682 [Mortierella sp. AD031]
MASTYPVPIYPKPCIAADEDNHGLYLVGVAPTGVGRLESSYISLGNVNSPEVKPLGSQVDVDAWSTSAPKACFTYPSDVHPNSPIFVVQYGVFKSYMSVMTADGKFTESSYFEGIGFISPKLFSMTGDSGDFAWFAALTNVTDPQTQSNWFGVRLNFTTGMNSFINTASQGYNVVFDKQGGGQAFSSSSSSGGLNANDRIITLSAPKTVSMSGITLSADAVPITMETTGYILDKAADGSTAIYSITPSQSTTLQRVTRTGGAPPFSASMVAVAMSKEIVTYSMVNTTTAYFNIFDTTTGAWTGPGLIGVPGSSTDGGGGSNKAPLGAIIGGVVGGIVVIALVAFLFIRQRRSKRKSAAKNASSAEQGATGKDEAAAPHVYTYVPETVAAPIVQQPVFFEPQAMVATDAYYNQPASVYDQNQNIYNPNAHIYDQGLNSYEAPGAGAYAQPPPAGVNQQYASPPQPQSHPSPYQDPAMTPGSPPYSSNTTKTGSPANPQFVEPHSYTNPKGIGSPQYVDAREPIKFSSEPEYYRP